MNRFILRLVATMLGFAAWAEPPGINRQNLFRDFRGQCALTDRSILKPLIDKCTNSCRAARNEHKNIAASEVAVSRAILSDMEEYLKIHKGYSAKYSCMRSIAARYPQADYAITPGEEFQLLSDLKPEAQGRIIQIETLTKDLLQERTNATTLFDKLAMDCNDGEIKKCSADDINLVLDFAVLDRVQTAIRERRWSATARVQLDEILGELERTITSTDQKITNFKNNDPRFSAQSESEGVR